MNLNAIFCYAWIGIISMLVIIGVVTVLLWGIDYIMPQEQDSEFWDGFGDGYANGYERGIYDGYRVAMNEYNISYHPKLIGTPRYIFHCGQTYGIINNTNLG